MHAREILTNINNYAKDYFSREDERCLKKFYDGNIDSLNTQFKIDKAIIIGLAIATYVAINHFSGLPDEGNGSAFGTPESLSAGAEPVSTTLPVTVFPRKEATLTAVQHFGSNAAACEATPGNWDEENQVCVISEQDCLSQGWPEVALLPGWSCPYEPPMPVEEYICETFEDVWVRIKKN